MAFPAPYFWIVMISAAVLLLVGFYRFIWFLSVGYGLSISGIAATLLVLELVNNGFNASAIPYMLQCIIIMLYGLRLGLFLLIREIKNAGYKKKLDQTVNGTGKKIPIFVSIAMWLVLVVLYYAQTSPILYRLSEGLSGTIDACLIIGIIISLAGLVIEALADKQKSEQKKENPNMAATKGLYKMCRCPNYFGEILVWTGIFVSGLTVMTGWQWLVAALGYVCIVYIMVDGAKRLEARHIKNYGSLPEYQEYANKTPIIIPLVPLYHLVKEDKKESK